MAAKWELNQEKYGDWNVHCDQCGAVLEDEDLKNHYWRHCYHCGEFMINWTTIDGEAEKEWFGTGETEEEEVE